MALSFYLNVIKYSLRDPAFRAGALHETWGVLRQFLPARLVTPRSEYVFCSYPGTNSSKGRWFPPQRLGFRPAAYALIFDEQERLLLVSAETFKTLWYLPGGGVNKGETLAEGLRREVREETGLEIEVGPVVDANDLFRILPGGRGVQLQLHYYLARTTGGELRPNGNGFDTTQVKFIDLTQIPVRYLQSGQNLLQLVRQARLIGQALDFFTSGAR